VSPSNPPRDTCDAIASDLSAQRDHIAGFRQAETRGGPLDLRTVEAPGGNAAAEDDERLPGSERAAEGEDVPFGLLGVA
jgi:hypothetical protein